MTLNNLPRLTTVTVPQMTIELSSSKDPKPVWSGRGGLLLPLKARRSFCRVFFDQTLGSSIIEHYRLALFEWVVGHSLVSGN